MSGFVDVTLNPWASVDDMLAFDAAIRDAAPTVDRDMIAEWISICTDLLYTLSGRQFTGNLTATIRPNGNCMSPRTCGCRYLSEVNVGTNWPTIGVEKVLIDGVEVDPSLYQVIDNSKIRYLAGPAPDYTPNYWPRCQYLERPSSAPGTFEITMTYGFPVPGMGKKAVLAYASQFIRRELKLKDMLPERTKGVTRSGMSMDIVNAEDLIDKEGKTGIYNVDTFLATYNPKKLQSPAFIFSPDTQPDRWRLVNYPAWYDGRTPMTFPFATGSYAWY